MFFLFDGHQYDEVRTLGEAIQGANEAIDCFADQCDPHWPEEVENISFGIVLGSARQVEHPDEHGGTSTFNYVIDDVYTETMKAAAEQSHPEKYDYCELVSAIADRGLSQLPGLLATVVDTCSRQPVFKDGEALLRFVRRILERNGQLATADNEPSEAREAAIRRIAESLDGKAELEFDMISRTMLRMSMEKCGLTDLPTVTGDPNGERASGDCICGTCKQPFMAHPLDWRVIGYGNVPFLNVLCDGRRVKL